MADRSPARGRGRKRQPVAEPALQGFKYFKPLSSFLRHLHAQYPHHNRDLHFDHYVVLLLLYFFNPIITGLRALQEASRLKKVQHVLGVKGSSLGSLSEAAHVFDASLLIPLIEDLSDRAMPLLLDPHLKGIRQRIVAVDGTLLKALPKMLWAVWLDEEHKAAKLHLQLDLLRGVPLRATLTDANTNERDILRRSLSSNKLYLLDAGFGQYSLFEDICTAHSSFVARLQDNAVWQVIQQRTVDEAGRAAGVTKDLVVRLGSAPRRDAVSRPVRVIEVYHRGSSDRPRHSRVSSKKSFRTTEADYTMLLVTDRLDLPAEIIALLYRYRWQIELFFRWFKCILGCTHVLSHSHNGFSLQVYCALIASMLITLWTGRKPTKRTFEMLCYHLMGWADEEELFAHIARLKAAEKHRNNA
jgi:IS4 transposase